MDLSSKAWIPEPCMGLHWMQEHYRLCKLTQKHRQEIQIVFLGASIVQQWEYQGRSIYNQHYKPLGAYNYGIGGDKTQNLLWRITQGEMEGVQAKIAIVQIGLNNISHAHSPQDIAKGNEAIIKCLRQQNPGIQVILVSLFPQYTTRPVVPLIHAVNESLSSLASSTANVHWLDLEAHFYQKPGQGVGDIGSLYLEDRTHLSEKGYRLWHTHMLPLVERLLSANT